MIKFNEDFWEKVLNGKSSHADNLELFVPSTYILKFKWHPFHKFTFFAAFKLHYSFLKNCSIYLLI